MAPNNRQRLDPARSRASLLKLVSNYCARICEYYRYILRVQIGVHHGCRIAWYSTLITAEKVWWYQAESALLCWRSLLNEAPVLGPVNIEQPRIHRVISALPFMERIFMQTFLHADFVTIETLHVRARPLAHDLPTAATRWLYHQSMLSPLNAHGRVRRETFKATELLLHVIGVRRGLPRAEMILTCDDMFKTCGDLREYLLSPWTTEETIEW